MTDNPIRTRAPSRRLSTAYGFDPAEGASLEQRIKQAMAK